MLSPVRQEWRRVATVDNINLNSSEQGNISGGCGSSFVASTTQDSAKKESAKAILHQLCIKEHWKQPVYECCNAEGPDHHKLFTFKVLLDINIEGAPQILECFGNPRPSKKAAAEDAAEGALWCLKHKMGNLLNRQ